MKKIWQFGLSTGLAALLLAGCGEEAAPAQEEKAPEETPAAGEAEFPVTLTDAADKEVVIEEEPKAIVSMMPSNTEIVYELGIGDKMVGASDYDNYPEEAAKVEKIGGLEFNVEKIISLSPDVVLAHEGILGVGEAGLQQLRDAGIPVVVIANADNFEELYSTIEMVGQATGKAQEADELVQEMEEGLDSIKEKAAAAEPKKVLVEVGPDPEIYTAGNNTFMNEMLTWINAENAAADLEGWAAISAEEILSKNPDVIVTTYGYYVENAEEQVKGRPGFGEVNAVKNGEVIDIDSDMVTRAGPRIVQGVEELAKAVYPEIFAQ
ncbi:MAG TPA: ABC transporter substrate-binding protein [Planococcus sp. (in: firmicutes)]|nr:ABC transporter substrate-binding protein [Planococcus sp. (in: firmicutes)]